MKRNVMIFAVLIAQIFGYLTFSQLSSAAKSVKPIALKTSVFYASNSWMGKRQQWWADEARRRESRASHKWNIKEELQLIVRMSTYENRTEWGETFITP